MRIIYTSPFYSLSEDVISYILDFCPFRDVLPLISCCRVFYDVITQQRAFNIVKLIKLQSVEKEQHLLNQELVRKRYRFPELYVFKRFKLQFHDSHVALLKTIVPEDFIRISELNERRWTNNLNSSLVTITDWVTYAESSQTKAAKVLQKRLIRWIEYAAVSLEVLFNCKIKALKKIAMRIAKAMYAERVSPKWSLLENFKSGHYAFVYATGVDTHHYTPLMLQLLRLGLIKGNKSYIKTCIAHGFPVMRFLSKSLKADLEIALLTVKLDTADMLYASEEMCDNKYLVLQALKLCTKDCNFLSNLSEKLRNDFEVGQELVRIHPYYLEELSKSLRRNREIVSVALKQDGSSLKYASRSIKKDPAMVKLAIRSYKNAWRFADESLLQNSAFLKYLKKAKKEAEILERIKNESNLNRFKLQLPII